MNEQRNPTPNPAAHQTQQTPLPPKPEPKVFATIDGNMLMAQEYEPLQFAIEKILPHGIFVFAGSPKVGKSWLTLDMCQAISTGGKLWDFNATQGEALYLALEDKYSRLQGRLKQMEANRQDISRLHLTTAAFGMQSGLFEAVYNFIAKHPNTNFIAIDTLEKIRDGGKTQDVYSCDYADMSKLRAITDKHKLTLLLVHHTRKMYDPDPLNTVSGSTGLIGAVDGAFVLVKDKRTSNKAKLIISNRDTESFCFDLRFDPDICRLDNWDKQPEITLKLRIAPEMTYRVHDDFIESEVEKQADGSFIVTATLTEDNWVYGFLLSYGRHIEVLEPKRIRDNLKAETQEILKKYL